MLRKFIAHFLVLLLAVGCFPAAAATAENTEAAWAWVLQQEDAADLQALADGFADTPGNGEEWLVLATLAQKQKVISLLLSIQRQGM